MVEQPAKRVLTPQPFKPIDVDDERINFRWTIRRPPAEWLEVNPNKLTSRAVEQILDGPLHTTCMARTESTGDEPSDVLLSAYCPHCRAQVFGLRDDLPLERIVTPQPGK